MSAIEKKDPPWDRSDRPSNPYTKFVTWIKKRYPWLPWACGGGVLVIAITFLFLWMTDVFKTPGEQYADRCGKYLLGGEGQEGEITQAEKDRLDRLVKQLKLPQEEADRLCLQVKMSIYDKREKACRAGKGSKGEISPGDRKALAVLAKRMGIVESLKEPQKPAEKREAAPPTGTLEKVKEFLAFGRYGEARNLASKWPNDFELSSVVEGIDGPLDVKVTFQFQRPGESPSQIFPMGAEELKGLNLTYKDNYRLFFETGEKSYLYIFQIDDLGKAERLFPNPQALEAENPLKPLMRYGVPSGKKEWLYLDEISDPRESLNETFYIVAARWEGKDLDEAYAELHGAREKGEWEKALNLLIERIKSREDVHKKGVFFQKFVVEHRR